MQPISILQILLILVPCAILNSIGMDIFAPALPEMMHKLGTNEHKIQYVAISFTLACGIGQPFIGLLCDKFGRRNVMLASVALFVLMSFATALANSIEVLALFRFLQGLGACGSLVVTFAVVNDLYDEKTSFRIFSLIGCALALTPMIAPVVGVGLMYKYGGWEACFYFLGIFSLLAVIYCYFTLPETKPKHTVIPSFSNLLHNYKEVIQSKRFICYTLFGTTAMAQLYLYFSIGNMLFIHKLGLSPLEFSIIFAFNAVIYLIGNYISTHLQNKVSAYKLTMTGSLFILSGAVFMALIRIAFGLHTFGIIIPNTIMTIGVGIMIGPATGAALQPFKHLAGTASGLFGTIQYGFPALLGLFVTRFPLQSSLSIAIPMMLMATLSITIAMLLQTSISTLYRPSTSH